MATGQATGANQLAKKKLAKEKINILQLTVIRKVRNTCRIKSYFTAHVFQKWAINRNFYMV